MENKVSIDSPTGWPSMCFDSIHTVQAGQVLSGGPAGLSFFSQALATLASLFFIVQQVHPSLGLGILSSPFSECCAPGFVKLSLAIQVLFQMSAFHQLFSHHPILKSPCIVPNHLCIHLSSQSCRTLSLLAVTYLPEMPIPGNVMIPGTL